MARTGTGIIYQGTDSATVTHTIASDSFIEVCLTTNPSSAAGGARVEWVEKKPTTGFIVHLSNEAQTDVSFDYTVV